MTEPRYTPYMRTEGDTVLDGMPADQQWSTAAALQQAVFVRLLLDMGVTDWPVVVSGLGQPSEVAELLGWEIAARGLGNGQIELSLRRRKGPAGGTS